MDLIEKRYASWNFAKIGRIREICMLTGHKDAVTQLEKMSDTIVVSASLDKTLLVWNIFKNKLLFEIPLVEPVNNILAVGGKYLCGVLGENSDHLYVWNSIIDEFDK